MIFSDDQIDFYINGEVDDDADGDDYNRQDNDVLPKAMIIIVTSDN